MAAKIKKEWLQQFATYVPKGEECKKEKEKCFTEELRYIQDHKPYKGKDNRYKLNNLKKLEYIYSDDFWLSQLKKDAIHPCKSTQRWDSTKNECMPCPKGLRWQHDKKICSSAKLEKAKAGIKALLTPPKKRRGTLKRRSDPLKRFSASVISKKQIRKSAPAQFDLTLQKKKAVKRPSAKKKHGSVKRPSSAKRPSVKRGSVVKKRPSVKRGSVVKKRTTNSYTRPIGPCPRFHKMTKSGQCKSIYSKQIKKLGYLRKRRRSMLKKRAAEDRQRRCEKKNMIWQQGQCLPKTPRGSIPRCGIKNETLSLISSAMEEAGNFSGKLPLYYQQHVIERILCSKERGFLLYFLTGGGKTLTSLFAAKAYARQIKCRGAEPNVVIVGPNAVVQQWIEVIETLIPASKRMLKYNSLIDKRKAPKIPDTSHMEKYRTHGVGKNVKTADLYVNDWEGGKIIVGKENYLLELDKFETNIDLLIVDEAHRYRTFEEKGGGENDSAMAKKLQEISNTNLVKKFLLLTATPLVNKEEDILPLLNIINNKKTSLKQLQNFVKNPRASANILKNVLYFFKQDKSFPLAIYRVHFVPLTVQRGKAMKAILAKGDSFLTKSRQLASITKRGSQFELSNKIKHVLNEIMKIWERKDSKEGKKIVVYAHYTNTINAIHNAIAKFSQHIYKITGSENDLYKKQAQINFNARGYQEPTLLLISEAGTTGVDLTKTGHVMLVEAVWHLSVRNQVEGRGVRKNSHAGIKDGRVIIHHFYGIYPENERVLLEMKEENKHEFQETGLFDMRKFGKREASVEIQILGILEEKRNTMEKLQVLLRKNNNLFSAKGELDTFCK